MSLPTTALACLFTYSLPVANLPTTQRPALLTTPVLVPPPPPPGPLMPLESPNTPCLKHQAAITAAKCCPVLPLPALSLAFVFIVKAVEGVTPVLLRTVPTSVSRGHSTNPQQVRDAKGLQRPLPMCLLCTYPGPWLQLPGKWPWPGPLCLLGASL